jgi:hypothetical protein
MRTLVIGAVLVTIVARVCASDEDVAVAPTDYDHEAPTTFAAVTRGSPVSFSVSASGLPAPSFAWRKDGVAIPGETSPTLTLATTTVADGGIYTALASNAVGSAVSNAAVLIVVEVESNPMLPAKFPAEPIPSSARAEEPVTVMGLVLLTVACALWQMLRW